MQPTAIILPVAVQAFLTLSVLLLLSPARSRSMREAGQKLTDGDVRLGRNPWSERATKVSNNYKNQFELPVLFYAVSAFALQAGAVDGMVVALAWVFALSRIVHAAVHIGPDVIAWRGTAFIVGFIALAAMWVKLVLHVL